MLVVRRVRHEEWRGGVRRGTGPLLPHAVRYIRILLLRGQVPRRARRIHRRKLHWWRVRARRTPCAFNRAVAVWAQQLNSLVLCGVVRRWLKLR